MSGHTPGPWCVDELTKARVLAVDAKATFPICDIRGWGHLTGNGHGALGLSADEGIAIQDANARLIAAAPDMLDALLNVRKLIAEGAMEGFNPTVGDWAERLFASQHETSTAIRKAEGKP